MAKKRKKQHKKEEVESIPDEEETQNEEEYPEFDINEHVLGHKKVNKSDLMEIFIMIVFTIIILFIMLKFNEII